MRLQSLTIFKVKSIFYLKINEFLKTVMKRVDPDFKNYEILKHAAYIGSVCK
jgi:hypothetical protein